MKVVIVAKTRKGSGACIGGLTFDGRSVRLVAADEATNDHAGLEYEIGQVWEVAGDLNPPVTPPHVENVVVVEKRPLPPIDDVAAFINRHMPPLVGSTAVLYEGLTGHTKAGALYITERLGVPAPSTLFWQPDQDLAREDDGKRIRYRYPTPDGGRTLTFVGFQEPAAVIPAGTLLRVSLAHWWRPREMPDGELRCYVQLSGWYEPEPPQWLSDVPDWQEEDVAYAEIAPPSTMAPPAPLPLTMESARATLKRVFGFDDFLPGQTAVIANVLQKRDTLAVMPTGGGKSLCFQLPALLFGGMTVVVSPLISLMQDQVDQLRQWGIGAAALNSTLGYAAYNEIVAWIRQGRVKLLYLAPETLLRPETLLLLEQCPVDCFVIDEAHCISAWGHDFRPEYRQLVMARQRLPGAVCLALTATATRRVRQDILHSLDITAANEFVASFDRPNLHLMATRRQDGLRQLLAFLNTHKEDSGIIYCATRRQVDELAASLQQRGWSVRPYHAGLPDDVRAQNQRLFAQDDVAIVVATVAFGMGIDKSNVRFVVHYNLPKDVESYYQEIGRAGRDGLPADCLLLHSRGDMRTVQLLLGRDGVDTQRGATLRLQAMLRYAETGVCRRRPLLEYFGEAYAAESCGACDNCTQEQQPVVDLTLSAQKFLSCVVRTGQFFGINHIVDVLRGANNKKVKQRGHDQLSTYGIGADYSKGQWQHLAHQLIEGGLLVQDLEHGSLKVTPAGREVLQGATFQGAAVPEEGGQQRPATRTPAPGAPAAFDDNLFTRLRAKRKELAATAGVPAYVIMHDRSLMEMAAYLPETPEAFANLYGIGEAKTAKYAAEFLPLIAAHLAENPVQTGPVYPAPQPAPNPDGTTDVIQTLVAQSSSRTLGVWAAYQQGYSVQEMATALRFSTQTILNHLEKQVTAGEQLAEDRIRQETTLADSLLEEVINACEELGTERLKPVFERFEGSVPYDEIKLARLIALNRQ